MKYWYFVMCLWLMQSVQGQQELNDVLQNFVSKEGLVDYKGLAKNAVKLKSWTDFVAKTGVNKNWSNNKKKAFWINVYNAYTLQLIVDNYPIESITKISKNGLTAWKIPFAIVGNKAYTLDAIEHEILRKKFNDPRIHVGVNCASISCPKLANFAFTEKNLDKALDKLMNDFINDAHRNKLNTNRVQVSQIFNWFQLDFTKKGSLIDYLNRFSKVRIDSNASIDYLTYNWNLNDNL